MQNFSAFFTITESKQSIVNLGFPKVIAKILQERFKEKAPLLAKWMAQQMSLILRPNSKKTPWEQEEINYFGEKSNLYKMVEMYENEGQRMDHIERQELYDDIKEEFFNRLFWKYRLIKDFLKNPSLPISNYKNLSFSDARKKYDTMRLQKDETVLHTCKSGNVWADVGQDNEIVGNIMKNCGRCSLMSLSEDKTMVWLREGGKNGTPKVLVTYSRQDKTIGAITGKAGSSVKDKYVPDIIEWVEAFGLTINSHTNMNELVRIYSKYTDRLQNGISSISRLREKGHWSYNSHFIVDLKSGPVLVWGFKEFDLNKVWILASHFQMKPSEKTLIKIIDSFDDLGEFEEALERVNK